MLTIEPDYRLERRALAPGEFRHHPRRLLQRAAALDEGGQLFLDRGQDLEWFAKGRAENDDAPAFGEWLALARRFWNDGRIQEMDRLSARVDYDVTPDALNRIAAIRSDLEQAVTADAQASSRLAAQYASFRPVGELETKLVERILATALPTEEPNGEPDC